jgi:hypothetical protein
MSNSRSICKVRSTLRSRSLKIRRRLRTIFELGHDAIERGEPRGHEVVLVARPEKASHIAKEARIIWILKRALREFAPVSGYLLASG